MSISPPSDIVLDVVNAVNPTRYAIAANRLQKLAQARQPVTDVFTKALQDATAPARSQPAKTFHSAEAKIATSNAELLVKTRRAEQSGQNDALKKAHQKLEGVFLQGIIKSMLSTQNDKLFGDGIAGDYWKSFMAEAVANQIAAGKGIGIANSLVRKTGPQKGLNTAINPVSDNSTTDYKAFFQKVFLDKLTTPPSA